MPRLNVNIDHIATLREARKGQEPDPVHAAILVELAGADGIVVHLREDRRHIQDRDLRLLRQVVAIKLNMEMAPTDEMAGIALEVKPDMITLVPEKREEVTTEGGLDVLSHEEQVRGVIKRVRGAGILVSLFVDPDAGQITAAKKAGADMVEIHTGAYALSSTIKEEAKELASIRRAVEHALSRGLRVSAGHGLNYQNVSNVAELDGLEELNIGHSIVSRSVFVGLEIAVRDMIELCR